MERAKQAVQAAVSDAQVTGGIAGAAVGALVGQAVAPGPLGAVVGAAAFGQGMAALGRTVMDPRSIREGHGMPTVVMREAEVMADRAEPGADEPPEATEATEAAAGGQAGLGPDAHTASPRPAS